MNRAFVFPGQGSQLIGMGKSVFDNYPAGADVFSIVDEALGEKLSDIIFNGPEEDLKLTKNAQPALMATSIAVLRAIESESGKPVEKLVSCLAGHSLGEYSALVAGRALEIADAARLLRLRGESMQSAVPVGEGAMAALIGANIPLAEKIIEKASLKGVCEIANDNASGQVVLSGSRIAIEYAIKIAKEEGIKRAVILPVSAPCHCALMMPAANVMADALKDIYINEPLVPIVTNITASPEKSPEKIKLLLIQQVTGRVRWRESIECMVNKKISEIIEVGSGKVLSGLIRRIDSGVKARSIVSSEDIQTFLPKKTN